MKPTSRKPSSDAASLAPTRPPSDRASHQRKLQLEKAAAEQARDAEAAQKAERARAAKREAAKKAAAKPSLVWPPAEYATSIKVEGPAMRPGQGLFAELRLDRDAGAALTAADASAKAGTADVAGPARDAAAVRPASTDGAYAMCFDQSDDEEMTEADLLLSFHSNLVDHDAGEICVAL